MKISFSDSFTALEKSSQPFLELFKHGSLSVELYKPEGKDVQQPHTKDEVYVVTSGQGSFYCDRKTTSFKTGDILFVPAGIEHRLKISQKILLHG
jgi:mannose-6-phosphate isomerase-like protein (cupin superfamily)